MASTDARPVPQKNVAYRVIFPILDADGDLVTGAASLDSEVSKDQGTFADCSNEATEIATSSGIYYLDLTATEMDADCVALIVKTGTAGAKTTPIVLYPQEADDIRVSVTHFGGTAGTFASGRPEVNTSHWGGTAVASAVLLAAANIAADAFTAAKFAAASLNGKGDWNIGKTGYALSAAGVQAIWDALTSALTTIGSIGKLLVDNINATISSRSSHAAADVWAVATRLLTAGTNIVLAKGTGITGFNDPTAGAIADQVWEEAIADHSATAGSTAEQLAAAGAAGDPWATALPGAYSAGQAGKIVGDNLNATVGSRSSHSATDVWAVATRTLTAFDASFKTGYALSAAGVQAIWDALTSALTTVGSVGKLLVDNVNATISSRSSHSAADVWAVGTRTLTSFGSLVSDIWAAVVDSAGVTTLLARVTAGRAAALDAVTEARLSELDAGTAGKAAAEIDLIKAKTDNLPSDPADQSLIIAATNAIMSRLGVPVGADLSADIAAIPAAVWAVGTRTLTSFGTLVADVWASATRTLTSGVNIVLTKGTGLLGLNDLSAAQVNAEADTALSDVGLTSARVLKLNALPARLRKNVAFANFQFFMVDSTDHLTGKTGLTVTAQRVLDNGSLAACANSVVEIGNGLYRIDLASTDVNGDIVTFLFTALGADARLVTSILQEAA